MPKLQTLLIAATISAAIIAIEAAAIKYYAAKSETLAAKLHTEQQAKAAAQTEAQTIRAAYEAYRTAAETMQIKLAEQAQQHRQAVHDLAAALAAHPDWAENKLPADIAAAIGQKANNHE